LCITNTYDELNVVEFVVIQLALLGNLITQMEGVTTTRSCLQPNKVCVAPPGQKGFCACTQTMGIVFPI
jgi:hypothetical protein